MRARAAKAQFERHIEEGTDATALELQRVTVDERQQLMVEGRYSELFKVERVKPGWLPEVLARLQVRYRDVPVVFAAPTIDAVLGVLRATNLPSIRIGRAASLPDLDPKRDAA